MLKKSQNDKSEQEIAEQTTSKKLSFKERIHGVFEDAAVSVTDFKENSGKSFAKWSLVYIIIAFLSLFLFINFPIPSFNSSIPSPVFALTANSLSSSINSLIGLCLSSLL